MTERSEARFLEKLRALITEIDSDSDKTFYDFRGFRFSSALFKEHVFLKKASYAWASFDEIADFEGTVFKQGANFGGVIFNAEVNLRKASFGQKTSLDAAVFKQKSNFQETVFKHVTFNGASFEEVANFQSANFGDEAGFSDTCFHNAVNFSNCCFGVAEFYRATFSGSVDFSSAKFTNEVDFYGAGFLEAANFRMVTFDGTANLSEVTFRKEALFIGTHAHRCFGSKCDFTALKLNTESAVVFERVNLVRATFLDTNLDGVSFRDVDWYRKPSRISVWTGRRQSLWDEFHFPTHYEPNKSDYDKLGENYSQLVLQFEERRDFNSAEDFYIGEMEMHRKKRGAGAKSQPMRWLLQWLNSYALYRVSSNYGTSYRLALCVLMSFILLFSLLFLYSGFQANKERDGVPIRMIEYNVIPDSGHRRAPLLEWISDYCSALSLTFSIMTFQKDRFYEPMEGASRLVLHGAVLVLTAQAALVLLAIRRRFKR